jgi:hypothetical protein
MNFVPILRNIEPRCARSSIRGVKHLKNCRGHYATTLVKRDGQFPSTEIDKLTVREIQMGFELSASRGLLTKYIHSLPACGFHPCNTDHHVGIIPLISYAKLNCMKTKKAVAMLKNMYWAFHVKP